MNKKKWIRRFESALRFLPDATYLKLKYRYKIKQKLNLENPQTYNEKLQWLKLHDRKDIYIKLVDKYEVKKIVGEIIGEDYIIPTIGVWNKFEDINFDKLPERFVLKCTHDSGGLYICNESKEFNKELAKKKITSSLKHNFYWSGREWPYKNVVPRIIAEVFIEDKELGELRDYKFFVFNGEVKLLFVATDRTDEKKETCFDFFDEEFRHIDVKNGHPCASKQIEKPHNFELMKIIAEKVAKDLELSQARIDLYEANGKVYFGEITLFHHSGFATYEPKEWDLVLGNWIETS